jgi:GAF domain-containing protein
VRLYSDKEIALLENFAAQAVIAMENARLLTETREALEQQTATAEVLQVINSSPGDLAPVFDAIVQKATDLCATPFGTLRLFDGDRFNVAAIHGDTAFTERMRQEVVIGAALYDAIRAGAQVVNLPDARESEAYRREALIRERVDLGNVRSYLAVALRRDENIAGVLVVYRQEVRPFSETEIALLQNFAGQAVIAMENARLLTETREALEQQTATAEVLQVINSSPGDLAPVFDAMLEKAMHLCQATGGALRSYDGDAFHAVAIRGMPTEFLEATRKVRPHPDTGLGRIEHGEQVVQIADLTDTNHPRAGTESWRWLTELGGISTSLWVALRKEAALLGTFVLYRKEVRPFSDKEISLVQNFAAQAVIAMENARLLTETREALEQQTATAEVLQVINSSPGDLTPVFDAMLEKATRLCETAFGAMFTYDGEQFQIAAAHGPPALVRSLKEFGPISPEPGTMLVHHLGGELVVQRTDIASDQPANAGPLVRRAFVDLGGARSSVSVALQKEGKLLGVIQAYRQEIRPFSEKQIALLRNFAAQAVIAMENARLITETREALEQQTATAEILQVINSSPGNLVPVYDVILEKARNLCDVPIGGLILYDGRQFRTVASHGVPEQFIEEASRPFPSGPATERLIRGKRLLHEPDFTAIAAQSVHPATRALVELGVRTTLVVPLRKNSTLLGYIAANRLEVRPFSERDIALLESFAAQAVIAMDNARLLDEIRRRQAELRVTFDNMGDGVAMFDGELRLAAWNLNFQRILDVPDGLLAERPSYSNYIRFLARRGEFGNADIEAELSRRLEAIGQELRSEHTRPDGRVIEVRRNAVPGGGFVIIYGDVTERKRAEAEIRTARDTAERALRELQTTQASLVHAQKMAALGQLTAGIAHEIKNPLNFVNNFAELSGELLLELNETTAPAVAALGDDERAAVDEVVEMLRGNLDKIAEHGKRADGIVKSMLEHSRGVSGERRVVDINALIEEALNLAYHGARAQDASFNISLEREFDSNLASAELAPQEMTRVFLNLFGNGFYAAAKRQRDSAAPDFLPTLKVATRDLGEAVEVRVRDNGTGIAPEIRDKLFQPFVTTKPTGEGTGLGLSIAYDIVTQQHGGTIEVDSQLGEFTEFTIRLPRARQVAATEAAGT